MGCPVSESKQHAQMGSMPPKSKEAHQALYLILSGKPGKVQHMSLTLEGISQNVQVPRLQKMTHQDAKALNFLRVSFSP